MDSRKTQNVNAQLKAWPQQKTPADLLAETMNRLYAEGLTTTSGGNLSIRDASGTIWITPGSIDKSCLKAEDIIRIAPDGSVSGKHKPSIETFFHTKIYKVRPDVHAVVHAHAPASSAFCINRIPPQTRIIPEIALLCGEARMSGYGTPGSEELGDLVAGKAETGSSIILLDNHGTIALGRNITHALQRFEAVEVTARTLITASAIGEAKLMGDEDLRLLMAKQHSLHGEITAEQMSRPQQNEEGGYADAYAADREDAAHFSRRAYTRGLFTSSLGSLSKRTTATIAAGADAESSTSSSEASFIITPQQGDLGTLTADETVLVQGDAVEKGKQPSLWTFLHREIYRRKPEVQAVMTALPPSVMAFGITQSAYDTKTLTEAYAIMQDVEILPYREVLRHETLLADSLEGASVAVLIDHAGLLAVGDSPLQVLDRIEVAEVSMKSAGWGKQLEQNSMGKAVSLGTEAIDAIKKFFGLQ
ncbi:MAG: class II aldolase/adducin family protein [Spirochaetales bacterium]|nr:class II aldolase/adducin family protein [Spirochaetales bacterium]